MKSYEEDEHEEMGEDERDDEDEFPHDSTHSESADDDEDMDERRGESSPKRARIEDAMDEIDAILEMTGMSEGTRRWIVTGAGDKTETNISVPGKFGKSAEDWMSRINKEEEHGMIDMMKNSPGWIMEVKMSLKDMQDEKDNLINIINSIKPLLVILDASTDDLDEQNEFASVALELLNKQQQEERYAVIVHGSSQDADPFGPGWIECSRKRKRRISSNSRMLTQVMDDFKLDKDEFGNNFDDRIVIGLCRQIVSDGRVRAGGVGSVGKSTGDKVVHWDDLSGEEMDPELVEAARKEEME